MFRRYSLFYNKIGGRKVLIWIGFEVTIESWKSAGYIKKDIIQEQIDRKHLEWLVLVCLSEEKPPITIGKGKELLGYRTMNEMRDFMNKHFIDGKMK